MKEQYQVTVGENLKRVRKDLDLIQQEVAGEDITRNLISLIENNKASLYDTVANIMAKNINRIMAERDVSILIKPEDLLNPERYDARKKSDTYIAKLENALLNKKLDMDLDELNEIEAFLNYWDLTDKKVKIYELLGDIFYTSNNLNREYYYYFKALESSYDFPNMKDRYKLALKLISNCIVTGKCEEAINLCNYMLLSQRDISDRHKGVFYYNIALAHRKLNKIDECLETLSNAKKHISGKNDDYKKILMLEGNCYFEIKNYDKALESYKMILKLLDENNRPDEICSAYINIIQIYIKKNDKNNVIEYFDKIMINLPYVSESSYYLAEIYFEVSNIYLYLKKYDLCEEYLNTALVLSKKNSKYSLYKKFLSSLMELYIEANYFEKLSSLIKTLQDDISDIKLNEEFTLVLKLLLYCIKHDNYKATESIILNILQKEKEV